MILLKVLLILMIIITLVSFSILKRNDYVYKIRRKAICIIDKYCNYLISVRKYDLTADYYNRYMIPYDKHLFSFWLYGVKSSFKREHLNELKDFM